MSPVTPALARSKLPHRRLVSSSTRTSPSVNGAVESFVAEGQLGQGPGEIRHVQSTPSLGPRRRALATRSGSWPGQEIVRALLDDWTRRFGTYMAVSPSSPSEKVLGSLCRE